MTNPAAPEKEITLFGLRFLCSTLDEAAQKIVNLSHKKASCLVVTPNVDHIVNMQNDQEMKLIFQEARYRLADGMPIIWFSKIVRRPLPERVTGADLLFKISEISAASGKKIYFLGGLPGVAENAAIQLKKKYPGLDVCGTYCPPFGFEKNTTECNNIINNINKSGADILFIGVGAPKQEKWAAHHKSKLNVGPILGVGAAFDFAAGTQKRAPTAIQNIGLEWLWRLSSEPRRLWRRYLIKDPLFIFLALKEAFFIYFDKRSKKASQ